MRLVWLGYSQAPGLPSGTLLAGGQGKFNTASQFAFRGILKHNGLATDANDEGIWSDRDVAMSLVVREGSQAPGTASGVVFNNLFIPPVINDAGKIAFFSFLSGPGVNTTNAHGLWSYDRTGLPQLIARAGAPAPGMPGYQFSSLGEPIINNAGQIAFEALLNGPGGSNLSSIWAQGRSGALTLLALTGQTLDVDDGPGVDLRTIRTLDVVPSVSADASRPLRFNDLGQLVFWADFNDNSSGIFISNLVAVPEPSSFLLLFLAVSWLLLYRKRGP